MEVIQRVENLIFERTLQFPMIQVIKDKTIIIQAKCHVATFTESECVVTTPQGQYKIIGKALRLNDYADYIVKIESDGITRIEIQGEKHEE